MPGKSCSGRKHTPITSKAQQGMFGAELARRKSGKSSKMSGITTQELRGHLMESAGKDLPARVKKSTSGSPPMTATELSKGYRSLGRGFPQPMDGKPHGGDNRGEGSA